MSISSMELVRIKEQFEDKNEHIESLRRAFYSEIKKLRDMTADRDEWRQQHENLLVIYESQTIEMAKLKEQAAVDKDFIEQYQRQATDPRRLK